MRSSQSGGSGAVAGGTHPPQLRCHNDSLVPLEPLETEGGIPLGNPRMRAAGGTSRDARFSVLIAGSRGRIFIDCVRIPSDRRADVNVCAFSVNLTMLSCPTPIY